MIDKLELRLPRLTLFRPAVREFILESRHFENSSRTVGSGRYAWMTDLRPVSIDANLHYSLKRKENDPHEGEHKLELKDTGTKSFSNLVAQVENTIEESSEDLEIMRIDLCADVAEVPVDWFFPRIRVKFKRVSYEMGNLKYRRIGKQGVQTISAGKRPNIVRIYDKIEEYKFQLKKRKRKQSPDADELTLKSEFGVSERATITRVEQQFGGGRVPRQISCFRLLSHLPEFNPFANIEILNGTGARVPTLKECGLDMWLTGTRLRAIQDEVGQQAFRRWLSANSSGNAARYLTRYRDFLLPDGPNLLTRETLVEIYRDSVIKQLAA
jgi:hypothetical protein